MKSNRWEIVFEDDHLMVIDKPAGLLSIPDRYDPDIPNLYQSLLSYRESIYVNHRLDKDTSGLIVFSKTEECHKRLSELFENQNIEKLYKAILLGTPALEVAQIDLSISANRSGKKGMLVNPKGKTALTKYRVLKDWGSYALVELKLLTGRTHQIRVHMSAINCPIICDSLYGDGRSFFLSDIKMKYRRSHNKEEKALLSRQALHAHQLSFVHPVTNEEMLFNSELPKDMRAVINQLDKNLGDH